MKRFLTWIVSTLFVSLTLGIIMAGLLVEQFVEIPIDPTLHPLQKERILDQIRLQIFAYTFGGIAIVCVVARSVRLPQSARAVAWGAAFGALAVVILYLVLAPFFQPTFKGKVSPLNVAMRRVGMPCGLIIGGVGGYVYARRRNRFESTKEQGIVSPLPLRFRRDRSH